MTALAVLLLAVRAPFVLCIDPGHPSEVSDGRALQNGLREVTVCWQVALELKALVVRSGIKVVMTKQSVSQVVTNRSRSEIANRANADLMLRLHADAGPGTGFATYFPNRRGRAQGVHGPSDDVIRASRASARAFHPAFAKSMGSELRDNGARGDEATSIGAKQGALTGSIFSKVPALLVEMGFLSNRHDAQWLRSPVNRTKMAKALLNGVLAVRDQRVASSAPAALAHSR